MVSGDSRVDAAARIRNPHATLHGARIPAGRPVRLPDAPYLHVFVARGSVDLEGAGALDEADAVRVSGEGGQLVTARTDAVVLVWDMHAR
jgi:redox-sensitive bicupin YhaK (pirin superfamily)